jgi:hypothetical protein
MASIVCFKKTIDQNFKRRIYKCLKRKSKTKLSNPFQLFTLPCNMPSIFKPQVFTKIYVHHDKYYYNLKNQYVTLGIVHKKCGYDKRFI